MSNKIDTYKDYTSQLMGEYRDKFEQIEFLMQANSLSSEELEDTMSDILDMVLCAQESGKPMEKIIGNDVKKYCNNYIKLMYPSSMIINMCGGIVALASILMIVVFIFGCNWIFMIGLINGVLGEIIGSNIMEKYYYNKPKKKRIVYHILYVGAYIAFSTIIFYVICTYFNIEITLQKFDCLYMLASIILLAFAIMVSNQIISTYDHSKYEKVAFDAMKKDFEKKKKKKNMTKDEFIESRVKFYTIGYPILVAFFTVAMIIIVGGTVAGIAVSLVDSGWAGIFFMIIIIVVAAFLTSAIISAGNTSKKLVAKIKSGKYEF